MALTRRAFAAATAAGVFAPTIARAKECPEAGMDWMTMSLEARNQAYFNVAHVGADFARQKTESWPEHRKISASSGRSTSIWLMVQENGRNGTSIPQLTRRHRASSTFTAVTGSAAARKYLPASPKVPWQMAGRQRYQATPLLLRRA